MLPLQNFCVSQIFFPDFVVVSDKGKHATLFGTICLFIGYPVNAKYLPNRKFVSCLRCKLDWKRAYLIENMMSLIQKHKNTVKVACLSVSKLHILFKSVKLSGKLSILVQENC